MATTVYRQLQIRRDTLANMPTTLALGELFLATDVDQLWIGMMTGNVRIY